MGLSSEHAGARFRALGSWGCRIKYHHPGPQRYCPSSEGRMIKVSSVPGEAPTPGLLRATSSPCPDMAFPWCVEVWGVRREGRRQRGRDGEEGRKEPGRPFSSHRTLDLLD